MRKILFLQNGTEYFSNSRVDLRFAAAGFDVDYYWSANNEFPATLREYAGAFLSGSPHGAYEDIPWIQREHELIRGLADLTIPTLGVCFGSQIIASALCGREQVFRRPTCEVGYLDVTLTRSYPNDALLDTLQGAIRMFIWHNDEVRHDHADMRILGTTTLCPNQIWRFRDQPIWGIQGHPELTRSQALHVFDKNKERLLQDGANIDRLVQEADDTVAAKSLIDNFMKICA